MSTFWQHFRANICISENEHVTLKKVGNPDFLRLTFLSQRGKSAIKQLKLPTVPRKLKVRPFFPLVDRPGDFYPSSFGNNCDL